MGRKLSKAMRHSASQWTWNYLDQRSVPFVSIQPHCWKGCPEHQAYLMSVKMMVSCTSLRSDDMSLNQTPCDTVMEAFQVLSAKRQHWKKHGGSLESKKLLSDESFIWWWQCHLKIPNPNQTYAVFYCYLFHSIHWSWCHCLCLFESTSQWSR